MTAIVSQAVKAVLGPTNTGKTHYAIERMLAYRSGVIGLPLRLLAREVYNRVVERVGESAVALVTGEERIVPKAARYWVATVEAMPTDMMVDFLAIDEIQTATDFDRGHVFTDRLLHARGRAETLLLGAQTMEPVIRRLLPHAEITFRPRFSQLSWAGSRKISRLPRRSAIVAFSASEVYAIAELLRRERGGAAVVMGSLSPRTRNAQVDLFQNGDVDFLVATDAIGMGLNLDVTHVAFASDSKYDGRQFRPLTPAEIGQIAGRAGRHMRDGTFGVTGGTDAFDEETIAALEAHDFAPVKQLQWRNRDLDFRSLSALHASLEITPEHPALTRVPIATDQRALEFLLRREEGQLANSRERAELAWACCQIPDFRDISPAAHGEIVTRVFSGLALSGRIDADWIAEQVRFCDNTVGDIDTLSNRIRQIRTWTFISNRRNWLEDPTHWQKTTRAIEDALSDALHERLIQRFVDRRTSVLMRHLRDKQMVSPEITENGELAIEGHIIGTIEGFRFTLSRIDGEADSKNLRTAASTVVAPEIAKRADRLAGAPNEEFVLATDGVIRWRGEVVAELAEGATLFAPRIIILADESLSGPDLEKVEDRLSLWLRHHINTQLEQVIALLEPAELEGAARGIAFRLAENLGIIARPEIADEVKGLDQDTRAKLRKLGVKFGAHHIYLPLTLKPAPRELALILWGLKHGGVRQPGISELPHIILSGRTSFPIDTTFDRRLYEVAGFKVAGERIVRVDILERLADIIRPLVAYDANRPVDTPPPEGAAEANGFRVTVEMTSLLGCAGEDFASILKSLGYRLRRTPKAPSEATTAQASPAEAAPVEAAPAVPEAPAAEAAPAEPVTEPTAEAAPEGAPVAAVTESVADTPAPDAAADAEPIPAAAEVDAGPAEPEFDEVWFPAGRRPERTRPERGKREGNRAPRPEGQQRFKGKGGKPGQHGKGGHQDNRGHENRGNDRPRPERREKPIDPDSPFAALAALKTRK
ncbi:helicase-related protein [Pelagibacterium halotolerans]|uniref:ATP-dependent DNA helicase n=1 Tax=Pelagibacterium halotolerans (strain DSM 22347 / JCM 15775 / CGMCC 1.7692 / B2) TaxID=1082931 RepID=G4REZ6_PELHB|nr:helicase-related protein [Pelagibacterium halotolerans]AEQ52929.1 ATP-dependent DNA helicase [Pelagibacterium halotolerans B2]QJR17402.1 helicase [Pelagibacterium halotolerans]SEA73315.1 ATP-dependent RNA helicase SUPV3L1/SUV3 [Pelagibacterium halotolerans]